MPAAPAPVATDVEGPGGRTLRILDAGGPPGAPVVLSHHGTPGCGRFFGTELASARARGLRLLAYDRPGYAGSAPAQPGRAVAGAAADVAAILDALGVERFATYGTSGGGPHALACAALLPERCAAVATIAGVGPGDAPDLDWTDGMGEGNLAEMAAARRGREHLLEFCAIEAAEVDVPAEELAEAMAPFIGPVDAAALTPELAQFLIDEAVDAVAAGVEGWADDDLAFLAPWGFDLAAIRAPALVWQGMHDLMVPPAHGRWLGEHVPGATVRISPDEGHLSLFANRISDVHDWLAGHLAA